MCFQDWVFLHLLHYQHSFSKVKIIYLNKFKKNIKRKSEISSTENIFQPFPLKDNLTLFAMVVESAGAQEIPGNTGW